MKRYLLSGLFLLFMLVPFRAANKTDLSNELESALKQRNQYSLQKETRIDSLKHLLYPAMDKNERFRLYNAIYEEYYTYRFDSAMLYVDREEQVAMQLSNPTYRNLSIIHRSVLLSTSGYFSESIQNLAQIDSRTLDAPSKIEYYVACEWAYSMWAEYSNDKVYAPAIMKRDALSGFSNQRTARRFVITRLLERRKSLSSPKISRSERILPKSTGRSSRKCSSLCYGYLRSGISTF